MKKRTVSKLVLSRESLGQLTHTPPGEVRGGGVSEEATCSGCSCESICWCPTTLTMQIDYQK